MVMCVMSVVGDHYGHEWDKYGREPFKHQWPLVIATKPEVTKAEFNALRKQVEEMKDLLIKAKEIDEKTAQPSCQDEEKMALLRKIADAVGISLDDVLGPASAHHRRDATENECAS
jgi:hypothetical protein